ncbi:nuclear transport factor 2 family protein [Streptomyces sp. NPDC005799]|uniref:nuclear transport factor 2 family protein n=1 Tax=Streptomyces sp. NPDC005799 TaxID=3154678 RepID=UPI0033FEBADF
MTTQEDNTAITVLIGRFFRTLNERRFEGDWGKEFFTDDVIAESPHGAARGAAAVRQSQQAVEDWAAIQYMNTDILIEADAAGPDSATASWNSLMTHIHHESTLEKLGQGLDPLFTVGGVWDVDLRRTADGWRFSRTSVRPIWMSGTAPQLPAAAE